MKAPIFVYGTLCSPQVVEVLLGRSIEDSVLPKARLQGHSRHPVRNYVFPGTIPTPDQPSSHVDGLLFENLTPMERKLLDWFEGDEYDRKVVQVQREEGTNMSAEAYIWKPHLIGELKRDRQWSFQEFCQDHLEWYLENTVRPCRREMEQLGMTNEE